MTGQSDSIRGQGRTDLRDDAAGWLDDHGDALYRHARARVGRREAAEDLVQETLLAALAGRERFGGRSAVRTWLMAILRRKIVDYYRRKEPPIGEAPDVSDRRSSIEGHVFGDDGTFRDAPGRWKSPPDSLEEGELRQALDRCMDRLPAPLAVAFTLRELDRLPAEEVRGRLGISAGNLRIRLYRARLVLRECLEKNWFAPPPSEPPARP